MLSYLRYNRISNGDYCKCMCLYSNDCEISELSNILDVTVVFTPPPFSRCISRLSIQRYFICLRAKNGRYQQPHRNVKIRQMSPIWFIIRQTDKISEIRHLSDYPTCYKHCIPPSGTTQGPFRQSRVRERSYSTAIEWSNSRT